MKTIGVFSSGGVVGTPEKSEEALKKLEEMGYKIKRAPSLFGAKGLFPGDASKLAKEFMDLYLDEEVDMLLASKGGYGTSRLLTHLDYEALVREPKKICGYSDLTAMIAAVTEKAGIPMLHGPMICSIDRDMTDRSFNQMIGRLDEGFGEEESDFFSGYVVKDKYQPEVLIPGQAEGSLKGGNLCVFTSLLGTDFEADCSGAILFLEDIHEEPYRIHRMMNQLKMNGTLDKAAGFILGQFTDCLQPEEEGRFQPSVDEIMKEFLLPLGKPVLANVPVGHMEDNMTVIMGKPLSMDLQESGYSVKYL